MENVLQQQLEQLAKNRSISSWSSFFGFQRSSIEERNRQQCEKELERIIQARQQFDRTTKDNSIVRSNKQKLNILFLFLLISFVQHLTTMN